MVNFIGSSDTKKIFHQLLIAPQALAYKEVLETILLEMSTAQEGKVVLTELNVAQWLQPTEAEI
jgi:hypothetical protein